MKKTVGIIIALFLMLTGVTGFIGGALVAESVISYNKELPLGDVNGIVVDNAGRIYVLLGFYGKVQVYNSEGQFVRNWKAGTSGKPLRIDLSKEQNILIGTTWATGDKQTVYDPAGNILSENAIADIFKGQQPNDLFVTDRQERYEVTRAVFPKIVRTSPSYKVMVQQNFLLNAMQGPVPAWLFAAMGAGLMFLISKNKIKLFTDKIKAL